MTIINETSNWKPVSQWLADELINLHQQFNVVDGKVIVQWPYTVTAHEAHYLELNKFVNRLTEGKEADCGNEVMIHTMSGKVDLDYILASWHLLGHTLFDELNLDFGMSDEENSLLEDLSASYFSATLAKRWMDIEHIPQNLIAGIVESSLGLIQLANPTSKSNDFGNYVVMAMRTAQLLFTDFIVNEKKILQ